MNGFAEVDCLRKDLDSRGVDTLLAGHMHLQAEHDDQGLDTYVSGQGLAHADLVVERLAHVSWSATRFPASRDIIAGGL